MRVLAVVGVALCVFQAQGQAEYLDPLQFSFPQKISVIAQFKNFDLLTKPHVPSTKVKPDSEKPSIPPVVIQTLILESVGDGYDAMVAVAEVIRNRSQLFSKSYEEVCLMPKQFSCWNDPKKAREFLSRHKNYLALAEQAWHESAHTHLTRQATDYHANYVRPYWADGYKKVARVGAHIFYRR